jgi:phage/plasmid-like protein (TIGR03299 family)
MPAYFDTGFSVREPMWHGQGLVLDEYPESWADARQKSGLTWEPVERRPYDLRDVAEFTIDGQLVLPDGCFAAADGQHVFIPDPDHKMIVRPDTGLVLGIRSDEYATIYHGRQDVLGNELSAADGRASMEEILEAFKGADGSLKFETAGSCRDGRQVWALLYLDEPYTIPGDSTEHLPFLALLNSHGGDGSCKATATQVRVVCWNTFQMASAEGERTGRQFVFRHVGDVAARIEEAKETIAGLRTETDEYRQLAADLMQLNVTDDHLSAFVSEFLPDPAENGEVVSDRVRENVSKARAMFRSIYLDSVTTEGVRGTGFGLLQSSTEYLDHARAYRSPDSYLGRSILRSEPAKAAALQIIRRVVK